MHLGQNEESKDSPPLLSKPYQEIAAGFVNGQSWQFHSGKAIFEKHEGENYLVIYLWNQTFPDPCLEKRGSAIQIHLKTLPVIGERYISKDIFRNEPLIIFNDLENPVRILDNIVANEGFIDIEEMDSTIRGRFYGLFSNINVGKSEAGGSFRVTLCDEN